MPHPRAQAAPPAPLPARVLVTGGAGFIGGHLVRRLLAEGARVTVVDDLSSGAEANLPADPRLCFVRGDACDEAAMRAAGPADLVVHLAGVVGMRLVSRDRERAHRVAVEGTRAVLAATGRAPVVLFSSSAVYGSTANGPVTEAVPVRAAALAAYDGGAPGYATGKWRMERLGRAAARAGRRVLIVRPFNVVGPGQSGAYGMVVPTFVRRALDGQPLEVYDDGRQTRCFSHVGAFVECLLRLLRAPGAWAAPASTVNVGCASPASIGELAAAVLEETGSAAGVRHLPYEAAFPGRRDVRSRVPDTSRLQALIGETEWPPLRAIVRDVAGWLRNGGRGGD